MFTNWFSTRASTSIFGYRSTKAGSRRAPSRGRKFARGAWYRAGAFIRGPGRARDATARRGRRSQGGAAADPDGAGGSLADGGRARAAEASRASARGELLEDPVHREQLVPELVIGHIWASFGRRFVI